MTDQPTPPPANAQLPTLEALGEAAWTLRWGEQIDIEVNLKIASVAHAIAKYVERNDIHGVTDIVPTFCTITVFFDALKIDRDELAHVLLGLADTPAQSEADAVTWHLPVSFDPAWGLDIDACATDCGLSAQAFCDQLTSLELRCHAMGFLPGFAYLAQLPEALQLPRLATPRTHVPAQTLAVAGAMAAIYPTRSPGGWRLLGHMPLPLFDTRDADSPALLQVGDRVRFVAVTPAQANAIAADAQREVGLRRRYAEGGL